MTVLNLQEFNRELNRQARGLAERSAIALQKRVALSVLRGVVNKTPVDTGRARANWQLSLNSPADGEIAVAGRDESGRFQAGNSPITSGQAELRRLGSFDVVWISNNVPYIERLENGHSKQAPEGMVALTLEEVSMQFGE